MTEHITKSWPYPADTQQIYTRMPFPPDEKTLAKITAYFVSSPHSQRRLIETILVGRVNEAITIANFDPEADHNQQLCVALGSWYAMGYISRLTSTLDQHDSSEEERKAGLNYFYAYLLDCHWMLRITLDHRDPVNKGERLEFPRILVSILSRKTVFNMAWMGLTIFMTTRLQLPNLTGIWQMCKDPELVRNLRDGPLIAWPFFTIVVKDDGDKDSTTVITEVAMRASQIPLSTTLEHFASSNLPTPLQVRNETRININLYKDEVEKVARWDTPPILTVLHRNLDEEEKANPRVACNRWRVNQQTARFREHFNMITVPLIEQGRGEEKTMAKYPMTMIHYAAKWADKVYPDLIQLIADHDFQEMRKDLKRRAASVVKKK